MDQWIPFDIKDYSPGELAEKQRRWVRNSSSEPDIEKWYQIGHPKGLPFAESKSEQSELDRETYYPASWLPSVDHVKYYPIYEKAQTLEKQGKPEEALFLYLKILKEYIPYGTAYYERPAIILERIGQFKEAIAICDRAIKIMNTILFRGDPESFKKRKIRLEKKISKKP